MARQNLLAVEFTQGETFQHKDGRKALTRLTKDDGFQLAVDEDLGVLYVGARRYSLHSGVIRHWTVVAPPPAKK